MAKSELTMTLPAGFAGALSRRHHGRDIPEEQRIDAVERMKALYAAYKKARKALDYTLDVWWEEKKVEAHFKRPRWYYAHRKLRQQEAAVKSLWKQMFTLLTHTDGNYGQEFSTFGCIDPDTIYDDFMGKYSKKRV